MWFDIDFAILLDFYEVNMIPRKWHAILALLAFFLMTYNVYSTTISKKLGQLRQKHDYFHKRELFNRTMVAQKRAKATRNRLLTDVTGPHTKTGLSMKENNTKREYVYYPEGGQGHFQGFHDGEGGFDNGDMDCGDNNNCGGNIGEDCGDEGGCEMQVPEYTHTHHVVRYHHHVGKCGFSIQIPHELVWFIEKMKLMYIEITNPA